MPFNTRRSSARGTPRGLFGNNGVMIDHSKSVSSYRRGGMIAPLRSLNHISPNEGIPFMSLRPSLRSIGGTIANQTAPQLSIRTPQIRHSRSRPLAGFAREAEMVKLSGCWLAAWSAAVFLLVLPADAAEPVLKRVVLSTGGVGYFEYEAA